MSKMSSLYMTGFELPQEFGSATLEEKENILKEFVSEYADILSPCEVYAKEHIMPFLEKHSIQDREEEFSCWSYFVFPTKAEHPFVLALGITGNVIQDCGLIAW